MEQEKLQAEYTKFINAPACRQMEEDLRSLIRTAFIAGWCAARYSAAVAGEAEPPR